MAKMLKGMTKNLSTDKFREELSDKVAMKNSMNF